MEENGTGQREIFCTQCGKKQPAGMKFCIFCGAPMTQTPPPQPDVTPAPPPVAPPAADPDTLTWAQPAPSPEQPEKKPKKKKKVGLIIAIVALVAAAVAGALFAGHLYQRNQEFKSLLETGLRYLEDGEYREAILAFDAAIEIKPKSMEAYLGRGDARVGLGEYDDAVDDYTQALSLKNDDPEIYLGLANAYMELGDVDKALRVLEDGADATGDDRLSGWADEIERLQNGSGSLSGAVSEYRSEGDTALLPDARIRLYVDVDGTSRLARLAISDEEGGFSMQGLAAGTYELRVDAEKHIGIQTMETLEDGEDRYTQLFLMIPETRAVRKGELGSLSAQVTNALNGEPISDAQIVLRSDWNNRSGRAMATAFTDNYGEFTIDDLEFGYYTAETSADDFVTTYHNIAVLPDDFYSEWNLPVTPLLDDGETRIVLTWNEFPHDLDSHLVSDSFHIFWADQNGYDDNDVHRANLDLDDMESYGPETVTIYNGADSVYTYSVYDYTHGSGWGGEGTLATSGATVRVYQRNGLVAEYYVPTQYSGVNWTVFRIYPDGHLETVNTIDYSYPGGDYYW